MKSVFGIFKYKNMNFHIGPIADYEEKKFRSKQSKRMQF